MKKRKKKRELLKDGRHWEGDKEGKREGERDIWGVDVTGREFGDTNKEDARETNVLSGCISHAIRYVGYMAGQASVHTSPSTAGQNADWLSSLVHKKFPSVRQKKKTAKERQDMTHLPSIWMATTAIRDSSFLNDKPIQELQAPNPPQQSIQPQTWWVLKYQARHSLYFGAVRSAGFAVMWPKHWKRCLLTEHVCKLRVTSSGQCAPMCFSASSSN